MKRNCTEFEKLKEKERTFRILLGIFGALFIAMTIITLQDSWIYGRTSRLVEMTGLDILMGILFFVFFIKKEHLSWKLEDYNESDENSKTKNKTK